MVDLHDAVLEEAAHEGESLVPADLVSLAERAHDDGPGVPPDVVAAYAERLADGNRVDLDAEAFLAAIDDRRTAEDTWQGGDAFYEVGADRISRYPRRWHDELGGSADVREFVAFLQEEGPEFGRGGQGPGVPEPTLLAVMAAVGGTDRREARAALEEARERGDVVEDADQHPDAGVYLADEADDLRDPSIE